MCEQCGKVEPTTQKPNVWIIVTNDGMSVGISASSEKERKEKKAEKQRSNQTAAWGQKKKTGKVKAFMRT